MSGTTVHSIRSESKVRFSPQVGQNIFRAPSAFQVIGLYGRPFWDGTTRVGGGLSRFARWYGEGGRFPPRIDHAE